MSGFPTPPRPDPGAYSGSWDFTTFLQQTANERAVSQGPGGTTVILYKDTLLPPPPSQEGLARRDQTLNVRTSDPKLDEPSMAGIGLWSLQFSNTILHILLNSMPTTEGNEGVTGDESLAASLAYRQAALHQALVEAGLAAPETGTGETSTEETYSGISSEGNVEESVDINNTSANAAFLSWFASLSAMVSAGLPSLSSETQEILDEISSTDPSVVKEALIQMANLASLNLSPSQQTMISSRLDVLANEIATANKGGGAFVLRMTVPGLMIPVFMEALDMSTDTTLSASDKELLSTALYNICGGIAKANFEESVSTKAPSTEYQNLMSGDPELVGALLFTIASTMKLPEGVSNGDLIGAISSLTSSLCSLSPEDMTTLQSVNQQGLTELLSNALDDAVQSGAITPDVKTVLLSTLVPLLATQIAAINQVKLTADISSQDPAAIEKGLTVLTGVDSDKRLNAPARHIAMSYIQALIAALVVMANLRCIMLQMETTFTQELAEAKISGIMDQLKTAEAVYTTSLMRTITTYEANIASIKKAKLMAWLMPLISTLIAVIMAIVMVVLAVVTVLSGGAAGPVLAGSVGATVAMISACIGAASACAVAVVVIADSACQWAKGKGMFQMLCESFGNSDPMVAAAVNLAFQLLIQIVAIVCTLGAYAAVAGAETGIEAGVQAGVAGAKMAIEEGLEAGGQAAAKTGLEAAVQAGGKTAIEAGMKVAGEAVAREVTETVAEEALKTGGKMAGEEVAKEVGATVLKEGVKAGTKQAENIMAKMMGDVTRREFLGILTKKLIPQFILVGVTVVFSSGLPTILFQELGKAFLKDPKKASIFSVVLTTVCMIFVVAVSGRISKGSTGPAASKGGVAAEAEAVAEVGAGGAQVGVAQAQSLASTLKNFFNEIKEFFTRLFSDFAKTLKSDVSMLKTDIKDWGKSLLAMIDRLFTRAQGEVKVAAQQGKEIAKEEVEQLEEVAITAGTQVQTIEEGAKVVAQDVQQIGAKAEEVIEDLEDITAQLDSFAESGNIIKSGFTVGNALRNCWKALEAVLLKMGGGLKNLILNIRDRYAELLRLDAEKTVYGTTKTLSQRILSINQLLNKSILLSDALKLVVVALQITAGIKQYEAAKAEQYYQELLAVYAKESGILQGTMTYFSQLAGIDQTATIEKIQEASKEATENYIKLLQMVTGFIQDAGARVSELANKGHM